MFRFLSALRGQRTRELPTPDDLPGYDRGVARAAIRDLIAAREAGDLDFYQPAFGGKHAWNVWIPARLAPETGGRRMELHDWVHDWIMGRWKEVAQ